MFIRKFFAEFQIFKKVEEFLTDKLMISFCKELMYMKKNPDEVVFYEGDIGKRFYIITNGKVEILEEEVQLKEHSQP